MDIFSNQWFNWFMSNYSIAIAALPGVVYFILRLVAIVNPNVPTNKVKELFQDSWPPWNKNGGTPSI
jgi:hypothetical protein